MTVLLVTEAINFEGPFRNQVFASTQEFCETHEENVFSPLFQKYNIDFSKVKELKDEQFIKFKGRDDEMEYLQLELAKVWGIK